MQIRNVTREILESALATVNERFNSNIQWKRIDRTGWTREGAEVWNVTLKARDRKARFANTGAPQHRAPRGMHEEVCVEMANAGVRITFHGSQRHIASACWHAHGVFFDALPRELWIYPDGRMLPALGEPPVSAKSAKVMIKSGPWRFAPGDPWNDRNVGSRMQPLWYSEACDCGSEWNEHPVRVDDETGYMQATG